MEKSLIAPGPEAGGFFFYLSEQNQKFRVILTPNYLDDLLTGAPSDQEKLEWIKSNFEDLAAAAEKKLKGRIHNRKYSGVIVERAE